MEQQNPDNLFVSNAMEAAIKIAALFLFISWCYRILHPFIAPLVWAGIIAVAIMPVCDWLALKLGDKRKLAAAMLTVLMLAVLITPLAMFTANLLDTMQEITGKMEADELQISPPSESVKDWPVIGENLYRVWRQASNNLDAVVDKYEPQIKQALKPLVANAASLGGSILKFILAIIISGVFMTVSHGAKKFITRIAERLTGENGEHFTGLAVMTVRNVTRGIIGVAIIQSLLASLGFLVMGVGGNAVFSLGVLVLGIIQISPALILVPISIYMYTVSDPVPATIFLIWNILVGGSDNVLKPLLMGKGSTVPTLVIFLGAIGGFLMMGLVGLFVGAVVVVMTYDLFIAWLDMQDREPTEKSYATGQT